MSFSGFPADTLAFLEDLATNNNRSWFEANRSRYENSVLLPAISLIESMQKPLAKLAPCLLADPRKVGGSLMRIYKDTRFSKDKTPYKTNIGIQFRHQAGKDVHAPGIYVHLQPGECFLGAGVWRPGPAALLSIRSFIRDESASWRRVVGNKAFGETFSFYDDALKSVPRGFDKSDPMIEYLRQKSFIALSPLSEKQIRKASLVDDLCGGIRTARPLMLQLCQALDLAY
ncbi:MAG: DUF2461 domain-containing protein [Planctomycetales bacterium]|nr:DUF2461 domain-containing protein [Planctomycetales bacterium]